MFFMKSRTLILLSLLVFCFACGEEEFTPEPAVSGEWRKVLDGGMDYSKIPPTGRISFDDAGIFVNAWGEVTRFDPETFALTKLSDFPGKGNLSTANSMMTTRIGRKGYLCGGFDFNNDFWEYDLDSDTWKSLEDYPLPEIAGAFGFSINQKIHAGGGIDSDRTSYGFTYEFNPETNEWLQKKNFPGGGSNISVVFGIDNRGFVGSSSGFWEYDTDDNNWVSREYPPVDPGNRYCSSGRFGYIIGHVFVDGSPVAKDFYSYDPAKDKWTRLSDFPGNDPVDRVFSVKNKIYAVTWPDRSASLWEYTP